MEDDNTSKQPSNLIQSQKYPSSNSLNSKNQVYSKDDIILNKSIDKEKSEIKNLKEGKKEIDDDEDDSKSESDSSEQDTEIKKSESEGDLVDENLTTEQLHKLQDGPLKQLIIPEFAVIHSKEKENNNSDDKTSTSPKFSLDTKLLEKLNLTPLIVFINPKSGGQQGKKLTKDLSEILNPIQIFDLSAGGPTPGLEMIRNIKRAKILVCGGDGTAGWVLMYIDKLKIIPTPPLAILPLGTGNDLSRAFRWGGGYTTSQKLGNILASVLHSEVASLDRWALNIATKKEDGTLTEFSQKSVMNNYFSIGVDAQVALEFHRQREAHPEKFKSRFGNKVSYTSIGSKAMFSKKLIHKLMTLEVDGKPVEIPTDAEGIVVLNLDSYMGGTNLWGTKSDSKYKTHSTDDCLLEIVAIGGSLHLGAIKAKLSAAKRLAQGSDVKFTLNAPLCVQIDGEPWVQEAGVAKVQFLNKGVLLRRSLIDNSIHAKKKADSSIIHEDAIIKKDKTFQICTDYIENNNIFPLIVFVNRKSGGQQGAKLLKTFKELLSHYQVFDLSEGGPEPAFQIYKDILHRVKILVCGGDGTAGWILMTIDKLGFKNIPPVAVLPLGTGNDLARALKWGGGYSGEKVEPIVKLIHSSEEVLVDRSGKMFVLMFNLGGN